MHKLFIGDPYVSTRHSGYALFGRVLWKKSPGGVAANGFSNSANIVQHSQMLTIDGGH
jgi:hypothetical protein